MSDCRFVESNEFDCSRISHSISDQFNLDDLHISNLDTFINQNSIPNPSMTDSFEDISIENISFDDIIINQPINNHYNDFPLSDGSLFSPFSLFSPQFSDEISDEQLKIQDQQISSLDQTNKIKRTKSDNKVPSNKKNKKKPLNVKECLHVWEFLKDMLKDERREVEWCNKELGIFKIKNPSEVAREWGITKSKCDSKEMSYPNMARGIRYSRELGGFFDKVENHYGFGIKLVYKFSSKARDNCEWLKTVMK